MDASRVYKMIFASVYPLYLKKVERKGKSKDEVDEIIYWLTGYDEKALTKLLNEKVDFETFFAKSPNFNPNATKITGMICGYRIEAIEDELMRKVRYLDKLIDELANGKKMDKILRK